MGSVVPKREIVRRFGHLGGAALIALLDKTIYTKSVDHFSCCCKFLDCDVELVVRAKGAVIRSLGALGRVLVRGIFGEPLSACAVRHATGH